MTHTSSPAYMQNRKIANLINQATKLDEKLAQQDEKLAKQDEVIAELQAQLEKIKRGVTSDNEETDDMAPKQEPPP